MFFFLSFESLKRDGTEKTSAENLIIYCQLMVFFITLKMNLKFIVCARKKQSQKSFLLGIFSKNATDRDGVFLKTDFAFTGVSNIKT